METITIKKLIAENRQKYTTLKGKHLLKAINKAAKSTAEKVKNNSIKLENIE